MEDLLFILLNLMKTLGLFTGADCDLLIVMIFAWTICADSSETGIGLYEKNRIIQFVCKATNHESETVKRLQQNYSSNGLFQVGLLEECFGYFFSNLKDVPENLSLIDKLFLLYYRYSYSWDELPDKARAWMSKKDISEKQYNNLLNHTSRIEMNLCFRKKRINGHLKKCLEILGMFHKDRSVLLEQLRAAKCYKWNRTDNKPLDLSIASDLPARRQKENDNMLQGPRPENRIYEEAFKHLLSMPVSEIINQLYYYDHWDDASYETELLLRELQRETIDNVLIINPSPDMISKINLEHHDYTVAVFDDVVRELYETEYKNITIKTFGDLLQDAVGDGTGLDEKKKYDAVLVIINKQIFSYETGILNAFLCCVDEAFVLVSVSEGVLNKPISHTIKENGIDYKNSESTSVIQSLGNVLMNHSIHPYRILLVPDELTQSTPKSKRLLYCRKTKCSYPVIQVFGSDYLENNCEKNYYMTHYSGELIIRPDRALLTETELFLQTGQVTIKKAYDIFIKKNQKDKDRYNKAIYEFSTEIRLPYTTGNPERPNRISFYYKPRKLKIQTPSKNRETHRETDRKDVGSVEQYIENTVIDDLNEIIVEDLSRIELTVLSTYTFKTQWLLVRPRLLNMPEYDDDLCRLCLFCHGSRMNNLRMKGIDPQILKEVMEVDAGKVESLHIWKQIQLIVSQLICTGILSEPNIVESIIEDLNKHERSGIDEVKQALDWPGLYLDQQQFIREYIYEQCDPDKNKGAHYYYEIDSKRIFIAAKLLNGAVVGEWLPQTWGNINEGLFECYSIAIGQIQREKGSILDYAKYSPELKNRKIALNPEVAAILLARRKYLEKNYPVAAVDNAPIFLDAEPTRRNQAKLTRMKWSTAKKAIKEIIDKMNKAFPPRRRVLPDELFPDVYEVIRPYQGDVLKRNFEYSCVDYVRLRGGLLAYFFGRKPSLTHDMSYVDYGCDAKLAQTAKGFNRWSILLAPKTIEPIDKIYKLDGRKKNVFKYEFQDYMNCQYGIKLQSKEKHKGTVRVHVKSKHAIDITVATLKREEKTDE